MFFMNNGPYAMNKCIYNEVDVNLLHTRIDL